MSRANRPTPDPWEAALSQPDDPDFDAAIAAAMAHADESLDDDEDE